MLTFDSTIRAFPFVEGFENGNIDQQEAVSDWTQATGPIYTTKYWTPNSSQTTDNRAPRTGNWNATLERSGRSTLFRPVQLTAGRHYSLEFYARQNSSSAHEISIGAKYGRQASIAGMTDVIIPATDMIDGAYQRFYGILSPTTSGIYYIGIQGFIASMNWQHYISLDDITMDVLNTAPHALPFTEDWDSTNFEANLWTRDTSDWEVYTRVGPTVMFNGNWSKENYSSSLHSFELDARGIDDVQLSFKLFFQQQTGVTSENKMTWQIWNGATWITLGGYSSLDLDGSILNWTDYSYDVSAYAADRVFKIRFVASGENPSHVIGWFIDSIKVAQKAYNPLPFLEDWSSGDFKANNWTATSNWRIVTSKGNPSPAAVFSYDPRIYNYNRTLTSHDFDARGVDSMQFSFELSYSTMVNVVGSMLKWEIWNGSTWITLGSYSNLNGELVWAPYSYDVSAHAANRVFKIRFVASGADSNTINYWGLDNIQLTGTSPGGTGISSSIACVGTNVVLSWAAVPDTAWYWIYTTTNLNESFVPLGSATLPSATNSLSSLPGKIRFFKVTTGTGSTPE